MTEIIGIALQHRHREYRMEQRPNRLVIYYANRQWKIRRMPWTPNDAERHTLKATTPTLKALWAKVANERLENTGDEGRAIREANAVVAREFERS
jgi:hypothetical protein